MMAGKGRYEDVSTILFLVPFIASGVYALYLWFRSGISAILPSTVYLTVTRDPVVFIAGSLAVFLGLMMDVAGVEPGERRARLQSSSVLVQKLAAASLVLALLTAWYANGFTNLSGTVGDFLVGRFSLAFPVMLVLLSYLATVPLKWRAVKNRRTAGIILMLVVPPVVYEVGKRSAPVGLGAALVLILAGLYLFLRAEKPASGAPA